MIVQKLIEQKLVDAIPLQGIEIINESHMHNVPPGSESHFKIIVIDLQSSFFDVVEKGDVHENVCS